MRYTLTLTIQSPEDFTPQAFQEQIDAVINCVREYEFVQDVLLTELPDGGETPLTD